MQQQDAMDLNTISGVISYLKQARDVLRYDSRNKELCSDATLLITRAESAYKRLAEKLR